MRNLKTIILLFFLSLNVFADNIINVHKITTKEGLPDNDIRNIAADATGYLYFSSKYETYRYDGYDFIRMTDNEAAKDRKEHIKENADNIDNNGNSFKVTETGLFRWTNKKTGENALFQIYDDSYKQRVSLHKINVISDDRALLWVSVYGNGIFVYNLKTHKLRHFCQAAHDGIVDYDFITCMIMDHHGNIWFSQEHFGVACIKVTPKNYRLLTDLRADNDYDNVRMLEKLDNETIIFADNNDGLYTSDGNLTKISIVNKGINFISACLDNKGRLWLGSKKQGITVEGKWFGKDRVDHIMCDRKGRVWYCGIHGDVVMATLSPEGEYTGHHFFSNIRNLEPRTIVEDKNGNMWLGATRGLYKFNPEKLMSSGNNYKRLSSKPIRSLFLDRKGRIWAGTANYGVLYGDVSCRDSSALHNLSMRDGLPNNVVKSVIEDKKGRMIFATEDGCAIYNPETKKIYNFYLNNDSISNYYNENSIALLNNGDIALGTLSGIIIINSNLPYKHKAKSRLCITDLLINGVSVYDMGLSSPVNGGKIKLNHSQNSLIIKFSSFNYGADFHTTYSYILEGYDKDWAPASKLNLAQYKNLPSGTYRLSIRYKENDGEWITVKNILSITVRQPLWASWWAILLYAVIAFFIGFMVYKQVKRVYRLRQSIALEKQMTGFRLRFFTNISHEFRTPLTLIKASIDKIKATSGIPESLKGSVSSLEHSTERMMRLINQLLEFRRMQNGKLSLALQKTDIVAFLYNIYINFHDEADNRKIRYVFMPQEKSMEVFIDRGHIDKIVYNLLSNAFKYTPKGGRIELKVRRGNDIKIIVSDTGIGISKDKQEKLFSRYATGKVAADSIGIGLNLTSELVKVHHGSIAYSDNPGGGSVFTVTIPADKKVYKSSDFLKETAISKDEDPLEKNAIRQDYKASLPEPMNNKTVLIVEDDNDIKKMLIFELSKFFRTDSVNNGKEALEKMSSRKYDLVITDVMMPEMNGFQLLQAIRKDDKQKTVPVIMLTALTNDDKEIKSLDYGADAYITKPFNIDVLVSQCANLIKQREMLSKSYAQMPQQKAAVKEIIRDEKQKKFVELLDSYISSHIDDSSLNVDIMAEAFHMGRTTFYNTVKKLTGKSPNDYLLGHRLYKAAECLREENLTIAEAAFKTGFSDPHYFSTKFKGFFGMSPREYKNGK